LTKQFLPAKVNCESVGSTEAADCGMYSESVLGLSDRTASSMDHIHKMLVYALVEFKAYSIAS
jgi:hypothetical protein